jgi:predicted Zn-dependent protease
MNSYRVARRLISLVILATLLSACGSFGIGIHGSGNLSRFGVGGDVIRGINMANGITSSSYYGYSSYFYGTGTLAGLSPGRFAGRVVSSLIAQGNAPEPGQLTPQQQYFIGRGVSGSLIAEFGAADLDDPRIQVQTEYLNSLGGFMYQAAPDGASLWAGIRIGILKSDTVAAYATPGGFIWISQGALNLCETEDELAALVAHELGHMAQEHSIAAYHKDTGGKVRLDVAFMDAAAAGASDFSPSLGNYVAGQAKRVRDDPYTEDQEFQADQWAVVTLKLAGYKHDALYRLLDRFSKWQRANPEGSKYLGNHPPVDKRMKELKDFVHENEDAFKLQVNASATARQQARFSATFKIG